jgi:TldD protein
MKDQALRALDAVARRGVTYADVRAIESRERDVTTKNGKAGHVSSSESQGVGIRVLASGCWGFAATSDLSPNGIEAAAALALEIARASAAAKKDDVVLAPEQKYEATWVSPCVIDPFTVPVDRNLATLLAVDRELRRDPAISLAEASMHFERERKVFASTLGSLIDQTRTTSGAGFAALCYKDGEIQKRSYPNSFGGQYQLRGYELVDELDLVAHAPRIADEAIALHSAAQCPEGAFDLILDSSQLALQIHESIGHPIELDRVLGTEANYAGMSFLTLDQLRRLRYGSEIVNVVCDARPEHGPGLGTFAFDDEGVPAQQTDIIRDGEFTGYMTSRETAAAVGEARSNGCMRAAGAASARRGLRRRPRHLHGDQPKLVHRRQALQLPIRLRGRLGNARRQARAHAEKPQLQRHFHRVLERLRGHRRAGALDALGCSELRQGPARTDHGHGPRRQPRAFPQYQSGERLCRLTPPRCMTRWCAPRAPRALPRWRPSSPPPARR